MGQRVIVLVGQAPHYGAVLYSNSSHEAVDVPLLLKQVAARSNGPSTLVRTLLCCYRYPSTAGNHRAGDEVFSIETDPGDFERALAELGFLVPAGKVSCPTIWD